MAVKRTRKKANKTPASNKKGQLFSPFSLESTVIALPLLKKIKKRDNALQDVIIDIHLQYPAGREGAKLWILRKIRELTGDEDFETNNEARNKLSEQYLFGSLTGKQIRALVRGDSIDSRKAAGEDKPHRAIYHIWPDFDIEPLVSKSVRTIKADAARASFTAFGEDIVWGVVDSGIDESHPHFERWKNLDVQPLEHCDFTGERKALEDEFGHGTHVAGILAGESEVSDGTDGKPVIDHPALHSPPSQSRRISCGGVPHRSPSGRAEDR
jgi:subtilisin family serine protease